MKKTIGLCLLLVIVTVSLFFMNSKTYKVYLVEGEKTPVSFLLDYPMGKIEIDPWFDEETGTWYMFMPSYMKTEEIDCSKLKKDALFIDGELMEHEFIWEDNRPYEITYGEVTMKLAVLKDQNLSTLFIKTDSSSNELMRSAKENIEPCPS